MISFFGLKELSNYSEAKSQLICLAFDLNEESQDSDDANDDNELDLKWQFSNIFDVYFRLDEFKTNLYYETITSTILNPIFEINCPPPKK